MAAHGSLGNKGAAVIDRSFYAVGGVFVVIGYVGTDVGDIRFGKTGGTVPSGTSLAPETSARRPQECGRGRHECLRHVVSTTCVKVPGEV
jgi:hypothetical protein